jgi:ATP-dependent Clp protease ATP-binding subunit ClpA
MQLANQEAQRCNHKYIGTEHILLGLVKEGSGVAANVLKNLDINLRKIRLEVQKIVQSGPDMVTMGKLPQTLRAKKVIEYSIEEARNLNHNYVGTEHLLLGLLREQEGVAAQVLMNLGLKLDDVREEVRNLLGHNMDGTPATGRLESSARQMGLWLHRCRLRKAYEILGVFLGGLLATLAGALIGGQCLHGEPAAGGAVIAGVGYILGVTFTSWASRKRAGDSGYELKP